MTDTEKQLQVALKETVGVLGDILSVGNDYVKHQQVYKNIYELRDKIENIGKVN